MGSAHILYNILLFNDIKQKCKVRGSVEEGYEHVWSVITADVVSEDSILKWYHSSHSSKGKSVFLEQMKTFVEWLQNAEEGKQTT